MCGIAGILSTELDSKTIAPALGAMQKALTHRGPDGRGEYFSPSQQAALAHTRLSIIDLSVDGTQPMSIDDGRYTISFNGEIYNYQELRAELEAQGGKFASRSDTEVILKLYAKLGEQCLSKLRGMFAFVIWDEQTRQAFAARDPLGIKPFYFWHTPHSLAFSSELRSLLASGLSTQELDSKGLLTYFKSGTVAEPNTLISDVKMLRAGQHLTWQAGVTTLESYWDLKFGERDMSSQKAIEITRLALEDSVRAHFVSDVPVGIFLSGGIDSTALVALAKKVTNTQINTYSITFEDPEWNEGEIARRVADHFGTNHTEFLITEQQARPLFDTFLSVIDQPTIDGFNTYCVSKLASDRGEKVVLSGLGGDELFAGYKSFELLPKMVRLSNITRLFAPVIRLTARLLGRIIGARGHRILDFMGEPNSLAAAQQSLRGIFSNSEAQALCKHMIGQTSSFSISCDTQSQPTLLDSISALELSTYMRNQLLRDSDVTSMAWGLELRVPFVDKVLIERVAEIPASLRLQQGKTLLIDSVPEIPEWVVNRPKQGFRFPFDEWFSSTWEDLPLTNPPPTWIKAKPWYRRWSLIVLNDWMKRYAK